MLFLFKGESLALGLFNVADENGVTQTSLDGWSFAFSIKDDPTKPDSEAIISLTLNSGINVVGGAVKIVATPEQLAVLPLGKRHFYAVKAKSPSGFVSSLEEDWIKIKPSARHSV